MVGMDYTMLIAPLTGFVALLAALVLTLTNLREPIATRKMAEIAQAIEEGAKAFMKRQYLTIAVIVLIVAGILYFVTQSKTDPNANVQIACAFILGALCSTFAGLIGMGIAVKSNARTTSAAARGLQAALNVAFRGGAVMGFAIAGLACLGIGILYIAYGGKPDNIIGFSFGASLVALFARVGGGIYTKAADVGADLVGKVEKNIPEDDPRNPAVIADNVGDNVGDCAGMGADLFESYAGAIIATMILGATLVSSNLGPGVVANFASQPRYEVVYPLMVAAAGVLASIMGTLFVRSKTDALKALNFGLYASYAITAVILYFVTTQLFPQQGVNIFLAAVSGMVAGLVIGFSAEYYTSKAYPPVKNIAAAAQTGTGTLLIVGFGEAFMSTVSQVLVVCAAIFAAYYFGGMYGIAVAGIGLLSVIAMITALDTYGPISDNAGGIAEMSEAGPEIRKITDELDAVGNTTKALTKGFAMGAAALISLALLAAYFTEANIKVANLLDYRVLIGVLIGAMVPYIFSSFCMTAVGRAAFKIVEEVRRQWRDIKGLAEGKAKPDYAACVDICTQAALRELIAPGLVAIIAPIAVGYVLGPEALAGLLAGAISSGFVLAVLTVNAGGAWDNAKKYVEDGNYGGKGSPAHAAAVVGDTLGDPFKDTSGPAINVLIKLMSIIALIMAKLFADGRIVPLVLPPLGIS